VTYNVATRLTNKLAKKLNELV